MDSMRGYTVEISSKEIQSKLIKEVEAKEQKIRLAEDVISKVTELKEVVIKLYLTENFEAPELLSVPKVKTKYKKKNRPELI